MDLFFNLPIDIQKAIISNFFSLQTRARFAQTSQKAKSLCYELTYDYPFDKTCTQSILIQTFTSLNEKSNSLKNAKNKSNFPHYKNRVKKLDDETHLIKLSLIQELAKEPRLIKHAKPILKTMNFRG